MALKQIKNKIVATKKTGKVTKAMEAVSAVKMRKSQERAFLSRPYVNTAVRILTKLSASQVLRSHAFVIPRTDLSETLLVVVTSDKGLAGSVNSAVIKKVDEYRKLGKKVSVIAIGRKAVEYAEREELSILGRFTNVSDDVTLSDIEAMAKVVIENYGRFDRFAEVLVMYQNFVSTFEQTPKQRQILPLKPEEIKSMLADIRPKVGKYSDLPAETSVAYDHTVEGGTEVVFTTLLPQLVQVILYHALLESKACEHSARMVAMKNATDKSKEVAKSLTLVFNKVRQAAITAEVSEITGGIEAMKN